MENHISQRQHKVWIDWMKTIGMLTIIWGHCFPNGMSGFVYAFNVPVFFLISGYLCHREESMRICFDKVCRNLLVPYFILCLIKVAGYVLKHLDDGQWAWSLLAIAGGFHQLHDASGCNNLWFVYTLILLKLFYQAFITNRRRMVFTVCLSLAGALYYNYLKLDWMWAVTNTLLAHPFFILGNSLSSDGASVFEQWTARFSQWGYKLLLPLVLLLAFITFYTGSVNDAADMFQCQYGNYFPLFVIGALTGSLMVFLLSLMLNDIDLRIVRISSIGTIVTLCFHRELLHPILKWISKQDLGIVTENLLMFLASLAVLLTFVPLILLVKRFLPIVLGSRSKAS